MNFLMVENKPLPPLVGVSSSTSECLRLVRDGRLARLGFGCWEALRILSLIVFAVTCKAVIYTHKHTKKEVMIQGNMTETYKAEERNQHESSQGSQGTTKADKQVVPTVSTAKLAFRVVKTLGCIHLCNTCAFSDNIWMHSRSHFTYITAATAGFTSSFFVCKCPRSYCTQN